MAGLWRVGLCLFAGMLFAQLGMGQTARANGLVSVSDQPVVSGKAIFYEERTDAQAAARANGTVAWSLTAESVGQHKSVWPAIHAFVSIPERKIEFELTIYRNTDMALPASHVVELVVRTPPDFSGRSIDSCCISP